MNKPCFTPFPALSTDRLYLRQITMADLDEFFILKSDERLLKWYDAKARNYDEVRCLLESYNEEIANNEWILWGIANRFDNKLIGSICYWNIDEEKSAAEIGYELMLEWHGKGIMQEAMVAVINYGFGQMGLQTIEAFPKSENKSSVKLLEKNGFARVSPAVYSLKNSNE